MRIEIFVDTLIMHVVFGMLTTSTRRASATPSPAALTAYNSADSKATSSRQAVPTCERRTSSIVVSNKTEDYEFGMSCLTVHKNNIAMNIIQNHKKKIDLKM